VAAKSTSDPDDFKNAGGRKRISSGLWPRNCWVASAKPPDFPFYLESGFQMACSSVQAQEACDKENDDDDADDVENVHGVLR
jgi:hypothetical protein